MREGVYSMGIFTLQSPCFQNLYRSDGNTLFCVPFTCSRQQKEEKRIASQKEVNNRDGDMVVICVCK